MIRIVLDTNIFVSALLRPHGIPAQIFLSGITGTKIQLCVSGEVYAEYEEVIRRPRLKRSQNQIESALKTVREKGLWVRPTKKVFACADPDDNIFLECAEASQAHYLVTGNLKDFPSTWAGTRIVSGRQLLEEIFQTGEESGIEPPEPM